MMSNPCVQECFRIPPLDGELNGGFNGVQVFVEGLDLVLG